MSQNYLANVEISNVYDNSIQNKLNNKLSFFIQCLETKTNHIYTFRM